MKQKATTPPVAEHHCYVVRIYRRDTGEWFSTIAKDAILVYTSPDASAKPDAIKLAAENLLPA